MEEYLKFKRKNKELEKKYSKLYSKKVFEKLDSSDT